MKFAHVYAITRPDVLPKREKIRALGVCVLFYYYKRKQCGFKTFIEYLQNFNFASLICPQKFNFDLKNLSLNYEHCKVFVYNLHL